MAENKLKQNRRKNDKRTYIEQLNDDNILLSPIEKKIFCNWQNRFCKITDEIIEELKAKGEW